VLIILNHPYPSQTAASSPAASGHHPNEHVLWTWFTGVRHILSTITTSASRARIPMQACTSNACNTDTRDLRTCEALRFDSKRTIPVGNFAVVTTNHAHCSTKNFNCYAVVIEIYFMFMILCLCSKNTHLLAL